MHNHLPLGSHNALYFISKNMHRLTYYNTANASKYNTT